MGGGGLTKCFIKQVCMVTIEMYLFIIKINKHFEYVLLKRIVSFYN